MIERVERGLRGVVFVKKIVNSEMIDQYNNRVIRWIEYRKDVLLDRWSRLSSSRALRPKPTETIRVNFTSIMHKISEDKCPLCVEKIFKVTTRFPPEMHIGDRIKHGKCVLFPNYYPFAPYHLVAALPEHHSTLLKDVPIKAFFDCLYASIEFFRKVNEEDKAAKYPHINCNYMPPAAASIVHPHIQVILDYKPTNYLASVLRASEAYFRRYGSNFWDDYLESEIVLEERFISHGDVLSWIASFAPLANYEVIGILRREISDLTELSESEIYGLARDLILMIRNLQNRANASSLNFSIYGGPIGENRKDYRIHVRVITRKRIEPFYVNDRGFMEVLHSEPVISSMPEEVAKMLR